MYVGRFAPSPTGPLHMGSLVTAIASYCEAKIQHGRWLVRIEDVDTSRAINGMADCILKQLTVFGFVWDDIVIHQSSRANLYADAFNILQQMHLIYPCTCTRKEIADSGHVFGVDGVLYPKTCLQHPIKPNITPAYRIKVADAQIAFMDELQGHIQQNIGLDVGDFILRRADGLFAYQLAVVVDDAIQGITHIVRGADLLHSTPRQIYLQRLLGYPTPKYLHVPLIFNSAGEKLSKHNQANPLAIDKQNMRLIVAQFHEALGFLGQEPPEILLSSDISELWQWTLSHWQTSRMQLGHVLQVGKKASS